MIKARCFTDDGAFDVEFDALPWLETAPAEVIALAIEDEWRGGYGTDILAYDSREGSESLDKLFKYVDILVDTPKKTGFDVHVDGKAVVDWLKKNKPEVYRKAIEIVEERRTKG